MNRKRLFDLTIILVICWVLLILKYAGVPSVSSDHTIFPLTALHLMQGKPFPFFMYGQDYMGTLPVIFILLLFKGLGVSILWVEIFVALIIAGTITIFSAFLLRETNFFAAAVFAGTFALFPQRNDNINLLGSGGHSLSIFLGFLNGYLFCWYVNKIINEKNRETSPHPFLFFFIFMVLPILTYWSSKLGFLYLATIFFTGLLGCRKILVKKARLYYLRPKPSIPFLLNFSFISFKKNSRFVILLMILCASMAFIKLYQKEKLLTPEQILFKNSIQNYLSEGRDPEVALGLTRMEYPGTDGKFAADIINSHMGSGLLPGTGFARLDDIERHTLSGFHKLIDHEEMTKKQLLSNLIKDLKVFRGSFLQKNILLDYSLQKKFKEKPKTPAQVAPQMDIKEASPDNFITLILKSITSNFQRIKRNILLTFKLYFYLFFNIIPPINFLWALLPLLFGGFFYFSKRTEFIALLSGNWTKIKFAWVILALPFLNILAGLLTSHLADMSSVRYFVGLHLAILAFIPLFSSLIQSTKLKNIFLTFYLLLAVGSYAHSDPKHYRELIDIPLKIKFLKSRYPDRSRLSPSEGKAIQFLEEKKLYFGYGNYWSAYRLTFLTHERIVISPRFDQLLRYKPYDRLVKNSNNPFYIFQMDIGDSKEHYALKKLNSILTKNLRQQKFGNILLFY